MATLTSTIDADDETIAVSGDVTAAVRGAGADLPDEGELARHDRPHRARDIVELVADGELDRLEGRRRRQGNVHVSVVVGSGRDHFEAALVICLRRFLTSRKSMSIAKTRW